MAIRRPPPIARRPATGLRSDGAHAYSAEFRQQTAIQQSNNRVTLTTSAGRQDATRFVVALPQLCRPANYRCHQDFVRLKRRSPYSIRPFLWSRSPSTLPGRNPLYCSYVHGSRPHVSDLPRGGWDRDANFTPVVPATIRPRCSGRICFVAPQENNHGRYCLSKLAKLTDAESRSPARTHHACPPAEPRNVASRTESHAQSPALQHIERSAPRLRAADSAFHAVERHPYDRPSTRWP